MKYQTTDGKQFENKEEAIGHAISMSPGNPTLEEVSGEHTGAASDDADDKKESADDSKKEETPEA